MTPDEQEIADVDRGLVIVDEIAARQKELKTITARLKKRALKGNQIPLNEADREGKQYLARGTSQTVPIVITADVIAQKFLDDSPEHARALAAADGKLTSFYRRITAWIALEKDGHKFRQQAAGILGEAAPAFIAACRSLTKKGLPKNSVKINWGREDEAEEEDDES